MKTEKNKTNTQQPDVKVNSSSLGEGECTEEGITSVIENPLKKSASSGVLESGKSKQYPSAEIKEEDDVFEQLDKIAKGEKEFKSSLDRVVKIKK